MLYADIRCYSHFKQGGWLPCTATEHFGIQHIEFSFSAFSFFLVPPAFFGCLSLGRRTVDRLLLVAERRVLSQPRYASREGIPKPKFLLPLFPIATPISATLLDVTALSKYNRIRIISWSHCAYFVWLGGGRYDISDVPDKGIHARWRPMKKESRNFIVL
jgi:hypothetical protein